MNNLAIRLVVFVLVVLIFMYMKFKKSTQELTITVKKIKLKSDSDETEGYGIETFVSTSKENVSMEVTFETSGGWELEGIQNINVSWGDDVDAPSATITGIKDFTEYKAVLQLSDFTDISLKANDINGKSIIISYTENGTVKRTSISIPAGTFDDSDFDTLIDTGQVSSRFTYNLKDMSILPSKFTWKSGVNSYDIENLLGSKITAIVNGDGKFIDLNAIKSNSYEWYHRFDTSGGNNGIVFVTGFVFVNVSDDTKILSLSEEGILSEVNLSDVDLNSALFTIKLSPVGKIACNLNSSDLCPDTCIAFDGNCHEKLPKDRDPFELTSDEILHLNTYKDTMYNNSETYNELIQLETEAGDELSTNEKKGIKKIKDSLKKDFKYNYKECSETFRKNPDCTTDRSGNRFQRFDELFN